MAGDNESDAIRIKLIQSSQQANPTCTGCDQIASPPSLAQQVEHFLDTGGRFDLSPPTRSNFRQ
jgi:hypothetical protein